MLVGTDPEFIVTKGGKPVPFLDYIERPLELEGFVKLSRDNIMLELNTIPASNKEEFIDIQTTSIKMADDFINKEFGLRISQIPFKRFNLKDYRFFEMGCAPFFNIYEDDQPIYGITTGNTRYCGGHIHIGYAETKEDSLRLIRNLDYHVGLHLNELPSNRRKAFGQAGEYRRINTIKVEYRTPSNEWLFGRQEWMYDSIVRAYEDTMNNIEREFDHTLINKKKILC